MGMQFKTEQKGQMFLVVNGSTGNVVGRHKTKGEADVHRDRVQKEHNNEVELSSARHTPPAPIAQDEI